MAEAPFPAGDLADLALPVPMANVRLWTPETPFLYAAKVQVTAGGQVLDELEVRFGMREITGKVESSFSMGQAPLLVRLWR